MTWFRIDDTWLTHPKVQAAGLKGRALWVAGGLHCAQHLTDGRIDKTFVPILAATAGVTAKEANVLADIGLWIDRGTHWEMKDFLDYQPSRESVLKERARWARSKRKSRHKDSDRPSDEESTVDTTEESRSESTPSRPVPSNKRTGAAQDHHQQPVVAATVAGGRLAAVIESVADYELTIAKGSGVEPDTTWPQYRQGIIKRLRTEPRLAAIVERHPDWTADQLRDAYLEPEPLTSYDELIGAQP